MRKISREMKPIPCRTRNCDVDSRPLSARWEPFVEHQIYEHACNRNVEPDGDCPTRDAGVAIPSTTNNLNERDDHERQGYKCQKDVRSEHREVKRGNPAGVSGRFFTDLRVVSDITNQETS